MEEACGRCLGARAGHSHPVNRKRGRWTVVGELETPPKVDLRRVAIHEAGHAVIGTVHDLDLLWMRITQGTPHELLTEAGRCEWQGGPDALQLQIASRPIELGAMCFAGSLAEERLLGWSTDGAEDEDRRLWRRAIGWSNDPPPADRWEQQTAAVEQGRRDVEMLHEVILAVSGALLAAQGMLLDGAAVRELMRSAGLASKCDAAAGDRLGPDCTPGHGVAQPAVEQPPPCLTASDRRHCSREE